MLLTEEQRPVSASSLPGMAPLDAEERARRRALALSVKVRSKGTKRSLVSVASAAPAAPAEERLEGSGAVAIVGGPEPLSEEEMASRWIRVGSGHDFKILTAVVFSRQAQFAIVQDSLDALESHLGTLDAEHVAAGDPEAMKDAVATLHYNRFVNDAGVSFGETRALTGIRTQAKDWPGAGCRRARAANVRRPCPVGLDGRPAQAAGCWTQACQAALCHPQPDAAHGRRGGAAETAKTSRLGQRRGRGVARAAPAPGDAVSAAASRRGATKRRAGQCAGIRDRGQSGLQLTAASQCRERGIGATRGVRGSTRGQGESSNSMGRIGSPT